MYCVEVASNVISEKEEAKQAEQWEVGYIFPATELLSLGRSIFAVIHLEIGIIGQLFVSADLHFLWSILFPDGVVLNCC